MGISGNQNFIHCNAMQCRAEITTVGQEVSKAPFQGQSPPWLCPGRSISGLLCTVQNRASEEMQEGAQQCLIMNIWLSKHRLQEADL